MVKTASASAEDPRIVCAITAVFYFFVVGTGTWFFLRNWPGQPLHAGLAQWGNFLSVMCLWYIGLGGHELRQDLCERWRAFRCRHVIER